MFESKRIWRQEAQNDKILLELNATISTLQGMAKEANERVKSGRQDGSKYSTILKMIMVLLKDLRELSSKFFDLGEIIISEVSDELRKYDIFISKLLSKMPGFILANQDTDQERLRQEKEQVELLLQSSSSYDSRRFNVLLSILNEVRSYERTFGFQISTFIA